MRQGAPPAASPNPLLDQPQAAPLNPPEVIAPELPKAKPAFLGHATVSREEDMYMRCAFNTGSKTCLMFDGPENDFSGRLASLKQDDRVEILSAKVRAPNGTDIYKVRFQKWTGWMDANSLTLEVH